MRQTPEGRAAAAPAAELFFDFLPIVPKKRTSPAKCPGKPDIAPENRPSDVRFSGTLPGKCPVFADTCSFDINNHCLIELPS
jgi:hypothetical protein